MKNDSSKDKKIQLFGTYPGRNGTSVDLINGGNINDRQML